MAVLKIRNETNDGWYTLGEQGPQGYQGYQGHQGPQGYQGDEGIPGLQGVQGADGSQGEMGPQGERGFQGYQGITGQQGDQGAAGLDGDTGEQGPQGWQGIEGAQGPQGSQGLQGYQGSAGAQGHQGYQGISGEQGPQGPIGPEGLTWLGEWTTTTEYLINDAVYYEGNSYVCIFSHTASALNVPPNETYWTMLSQEGAQGTQGPQGLAGEQGAAGPQGVQGEEGPQGAQGSQGQQGEVGNTGEIGPTGPQGDQGDTGPVGPQGLAGSQGPIGDQGDQGEKGPQGYQGNQGYQGLRGDKGDQGPEGDQGDQGPTGPQGDQGAQGLLGDVLAHAVSIASGGYFKIGSGTKDTTLDGIQIDDTEIVGQADGVDQVVIGTDGKLTVGQGDVILDENGIQLFTNTVYNDYTQPSSLKFIHDGVNFGGLFGSGSPSDVGLKREINGSAGQTVNDWDIALAKGAGIVYKYLNAYRESTESPYVLDRATYSAKASASESLIEIIAKHNHLNSDPVTYHEAILKLWATLSGSSLTLTAENTDIIGNTEISENLIVDGTIEDGDGNLYGRPVFLTTPLTSTSWDGDSKGTGDRNIVDLSSVFGVPAGVKAVMMSVQTQGASANLYVRFGPNSTNNFTLSCRTAVAGQIAQAIGIVPCDTNGDIYCYPSGTVAGVYVWIWGYWL